MLGGMGLVAWVIALAACRTERPPEPPPPPPRPACNGIMQTTCVPPLLPLGSCPPAAQVSTPCNGLTAISEGQLTPAGCCYSMCAGIPNCAGPSPY